MTVSRKRKKLLKTAKLERKAALDAGDTSAAEKIARELIRPLQRAIAGETLTALQNQATALNALSDIIERAVANLQGRIDNFFLDDVVAEARRLAVIADTASDDQGFGRAEEGGGAGSAGGAAEASESQPSGGAEASPGADISDGNEAAVTAAQEAPPVGAAAMREAYKKMKIRPEWTAAIDAEAAIFLRNDAERRYRTVERETGVPWWVVGMLHKMEASQNFRKHLHNGDPLDAKTVNVPKNRPPDWQAGMTWEQSAVDAVVFKGYDAITDWSLGAFLDRAEGWNGLGYRNRGIWTPFLWAGSTYYDRGKFVRDHVFDPEFRSKQVGIAVLLNKLSEMGVLKIAGDKPVVVNPDSAVREPRAESPDTQPFSHADDEIDFPVASSKTIKNGFGIGRRNTSDNRAAARRVQEWLTLHDIITSVDGGFGDATEACVRQFQRRHGLAETGEVDTECWARLTAPLRAALGRVAETDGSSTPGLAETVLDVAAQHLSQSPSEVGGNNAGPWVRLYMLGEDAGIGGGKSHPWCAGFVCFVVAQACRDLAVDLPFDRQALVANLARDAKADGRFVDGDDIGTGETRAAHVPVGGLFVRRGGPNGWDHTGIVTAAGSKTFFTIEGNTTGGDVDGGRDGGIAKSSTRSYGSYDFIRLI